MITDHFLRVLAPIALKYLADRYLRKKDTNVSKDITVSKVCLCQQKGRRSQPYKRIKRRYKRKIRPYSNR